jgi:excisionase family DNA binding protein
MIDTKNPLPLSISGAAYHIGASEQVVRRAIKNGALKAHKFGPKCVRIMPEDLADWMKRSVKPRKPPKAKKPEVV